MAAAEVLFGLDDDSELQFPIECAQSVCSEADSGVQSPTTVSSGSMTSDTPLLDVMRSQYSSNLKELDLDLANLKIGSALDNEDDILRDDDWTPTGSSQHLSNEDFGGRPKSPSKSAGSPMTPPPSSLCRRSASLRSSLKTAASCGQIKKAVRFADSLGLDLEHRRSFDYEDDFTWMHYESPDFSRFYYDDPFASPSLLSPRRKLTGPALNCGSPSLPLTSSPIKARPAKSKSVKKHLVMCFSLSDPHTIEKQLRGGQQFVSLENVTVTDMSVSGVIRVANLAFEKQVLVRYSLDHWATWTELGATYIPNSSDGYTDKFSFTLFLPQDLPVFSLCHFCICFTTANQRHWDNNGGRNFILKVEEERPNAVDVEDTSKAINSWLYFY